MNERYNDVRKGVSNAVLFFLIVLALLDLIAIIPWFSVFQDFMKTPTNIDAFTGFIYGLLGFLVMHLFTVPLSIVLTEIYKKLTRHN